MGKKIILTLYFLVLGMTFSNAGFAADLTFTGKIKLTRAHPKTEKALVECQLFNKNQLVAKRSAKLVVPPTGTLDQTFSITFPSTNGGNTIIANRYKCELLFLRKANNNSGSGLFNIQVPAIRFPKKALGSSANLCRNQNEQYRCAKLGMGGRFLKEGVLP